MDSLFSPDFDQEDAFLSPYLIGEKNLKGIKKTPAVKPPAKKIEKKALPLPEVKPEPEEMPPPTPEPQEPGIKLPIGSTSKRDKLDLSKVYNTLDIPDMPVPDRIQPPPPPVMKFSDSLKTLKNLDGTPLGFVQKKYLETEIISPEKKRRRHS